MVVKGSYFDNLFYTGVGSRETPNDICNMFSHIAIHLQKNGFILRSGGARGADVAFSKHVTNHEIYIPDEGFNKHYSFMRGVINPKTHDNYMDARKIARRVHGHFDLCNAFGKNAHTRNIYQVLGLYLDTPSKFLLAWTNDGACKRDEITIDTGGTATALKIALELNVPVFNFKNDSCVTRFESFMKETYQLTF